MTKILLILFSPLFFVNAAFAVTYAAPVTVTATGTSTKVLNANGLRTALVIQNQGSVGIIIKFGSVQTAHEGIVVAAGTSFDRSANAPTGAVYMETQSSTAVVVLVQGQ